MFVDTEELMIALASQWLSLPAGQVSNEMPNNPPLPFVLVTRITAYDDKVTESASCDVEFFTTSRSSSIDLARRFHSRVLAFTPKLSVTLSSGPVCVDSIQTIQGPAWLDYGDEGLKRVLARYGVASRINSQPL